MTRYCLMLSVALILSGCGGPDRDADMTETDIVDAAVVSTESTDLAEPTEAAATHYDAEGAVLITVDRIVPEPNACLLMMSVVNGTDDTVTAGLFAFAVTGNGETAGANMFPQTTDAGDVKTAQIVLPGADCANAQTIEGGQLNCRIVETGESCADITELRDGEIDFEQAG